MHLYKKYESLKNVHQDSKIIVCGCGTSALLAKDLNCITIGVNDIGRLFTPDYLVVINDKKSFSDNRWNHIKNTKAKHVFTHIAKPQSPKDLELNDLSKLVLIKLGRYGGTNVNGPYVDYTSNSPYVGVMIAKHLGAKKIGLLGVDFTRDHFFGKTGDHPLMSRLSAIITEYNALHQALMLSGTELYNLSPNSKLNIPKMAVDDFMSS